MVKQDYPKGGNSLQPVKLPSIVRTYILQQAFRLSAPDLEVAYYDSTSPRRITTVGAGTCSPVPLHSSPTSISESSITHAIFDGRGKSRWAAGTLENLVPPPRDLDPFPFGKFPEFKALKTTCNSAEAPISPSKSTGNGQKTFSEPSIITC